MGMKENTLLSILVCVFEASATILTFVRSIQALSYGGGSLALKKHTLDYLIVEQGVLYFGYAINNRCISSLNERAFGVKTCLCVHCWRDGVELRTSRSGIISLSSAHADAAVTFPLQKAAVCWIYSPLLIRNLF